MRRKRTQPTGEPLTLEQISDLLYGSADQASFIFRARMNPVQTTEMMLVRERQRYSDDEDFFWYSFGTDWRGKFRVYGGPKRFQKRLMGLLREHRFKHPIEVEEIDYPYRRRM